MIDHTHDPALKSWVASANGHSDFPIQNLPVGVFSTKDRIARGGVAIGDQVLDLGAAVRIGLIDGDAKRAAELASGSSLNSFLALGSSARRALRHSLSDLLAEDSTEKNILEPLLYDAAAIEMHLPAAIGDYTDFYVGIHHATNVGKLFRPDNPLLPNYKYVPIGYHGRASSIDVQAWEYQPLGPFLSKSFASTISPWIIMPEAFAPFRTAQPKRPEGDPDPLPYLADPQDQSHGAFNIEFEVLLVTPELERQGLAPHRISISGTRHMYWTVAQMVTHHTMNGCDLRPGDFLGSGTLSGPDLQSCGSLLEATEGGRQPLRLPSGEERRFLEDGDEIILKAHARQNGFATIGMGECRATIQPGR